MFTRRYFPTRFFAPRYWPAGIAVVAVVYRMTGKLRVAPLMAGYTRVRARLTGRARTALRLTGTLNIRE